MSLAPARVVSVDRLSESMYVLRARLLRALGCAPKPFQFLMVWVPGVEEFPMSVSMFSRDVVQIVFKLRGRGTRALASMKPGDFVGFRGPFGRGLDADALGSKVLVVAGGVGIAPVPYAVNVWRSAGLSVDVVWGLRSVDELFDLRAIGIDSADVRILVATDDGSYGFHGSAVDLVARIVGSGERYDSIVGVGPKPMLHALCKLAKDLGMDGRVWVSLETIVKCGMGICGSCCLRPLPKLLCRDGPVFRCVEVEEYLERAS